MDISIDMLSLGNADGIIVWLKDSSVSLVAIVFAVVTSILVGIHKATIWGGTLWYIVITLGQYLLLVVVTQNYGKRFVCTVLAEASK